MSIKVRKAGIINALFVIAVLLNVLIPKGGFKILNIPITWGYLYLGLIFLYTSILIFGNPDFRINKKNLICYFSTLPFLLYFIINILIRGYEGNLGNLVSCFINFAFLPILFYINLGYYLKKIELTFIENWIKKIVFIVSAYGVFLFIYKQFTGNFIEIPYITVNSADIGELGNKNNNRGGVFKLISTYNNGNIFGICILMLLPMFMKNKPSLLKKSIVILALILTLSRTVWLGLLFYYLLIYRKKILSIVKILLITSIIVFSLTMLVMSSISSYSSFSNFLFDANLGGRLKQFSNVKLSLFGCNKFSNIAEIVYISIFEQLGLIGVILFCFSFFMPIYIAFKTSSQNRYLIGAIIYLFICMSDGAMLLIPVLAFFYFVCTMAMISKNRT